MEKILGFVVGVIVVVALGFALVRGLDEPVAFYSHVTKECAFVMMPHEETGEAMKVPCDKFSEAELNAFQRGWSQ